MSAFNKHVPLGSNDGYKHMRLQYVLAIEQLLEDDKTINVILSRNVKVAIKKFEKQHKIKDSMGKWTEKNLMTKLDDKIKMRKRRKDEKFVNRNIKLIF